MSIIENVENVEEQELLSLDALLLESFAPFRLDPSVELNWFTEEIKKEEKRWKQIRRWKTELIAALIFWSFLFLNYEAIFPQFHPGTQFLEAKESTFLEKALPHTKFSKTTEASSDTLSENQNTVPTTQENKSQEIFFQPRTSTKIQGKIAWVEDSQIGIEEVLGNEAITVGDFFSVYRAHQKIGVVLLSESTKTPVAHLIYQTVPFQKGDRIVLEVQSKHFLTESL